MTNKVINHFMRILIRTVIICIYFLFVNNAEKLCENLKKVKMCMLRGLPLAGFWTGKVFLFFGRIFEGFGVHGFYIGEGDLGDGGDILRGDFGNGADETLLLCIGMADGGGKDSGDCVLFGCGGEHFPCAGAEPEFADAEFSAHKLHKRLVRSNTAQLKV